MNTYIYYDANIDKYMTVEEVRDAAKNYIDANEWDDGSKPSIGEVIENNDECIAFNYNEEIFVDGQDRRCDISNLDVAQIVNALNNHIIFIY